MTILYVVLSFIAGCTVTYFALRLKFDLEKTSLKVRLETVQESQKTTQQLCDVIKEEFVNLANSALLSNQQKLEQDSAKKLDSHINPLKERMFEFQKKIEEFNLNGIQNANIIKEQIKSLTNENNLIRTQAENLTRALKDNSKTRGIFGEMILENILKTSGLINRNEDAERGNYITQKGFRSNLNPDGAKITPDAVVYYPEDNKNIVIDSKLSLVDFLEYINCEDKEEQQSILKDFYKSIEERVNELSGKYHDLDGLCTPDFTLMFVPVESCINYIYANQKIVEDAYKKRVIIVGPASLIATLRVIKYSWSQKNQEKNVRDILKLADGIYSKVSTLINNLEKLQTNFSTMQKTFLGLFTTLRGRGGLFSQTEKLRDYGISPSGTIDKKYLEVQDAELVEIQ